MKRLRKNSRMPGVRFFCVGEYGARTGREHWHLCLFGLGFPKGLFHIKEWPHGACYGGNVTTASAKYTARYSLKSGPKGGEYLMQPSRRPGIGVPRAEEIARHIAKAQPSIPRFPNWWKIGSQTLPLDKTLREKCVAAYLGAGGIIEEKQRSQITLDLQARVYAVMGDPRSETNSIFVSELERKVRNGTF